MKPLESGKPTPRRALCLLALGCLLPLAAPAEIVVPEGYTVELLVSGLNGPEGMALIGSGRIAVCEAQNVLPDPASMDRVLTLVTRNGKARRLVLEAGAPPWIDIVRDPDRGYFVTQIGVPLPPRGVQQIGTDGSLGDFFPTPGFPIGIAHDRRTDDLYVSTAVGGSGRILRIDAFGNVFVFRHQTRADGLAVTDDGILLSAVVSRLHEGGTAFNQVVAYDLLTGDEAVLADDVGDRINFLAVGADGEIFVSDADRGEIRRLVPLETGGYEVELFATGFSTDSVRTPDLSYLGLVAAPDGRLYASDFNAGEVYAIYRER